MAQPFDAAKPRPRASPSRIGEGLGIDNVGGASFSISNNGVLAFRSGEQQGRRLALDGSLGKETPALQDELRNYADTGISPDGKRLAFDVERRPADKADLWIRDLSRDVTTRFTFDKEREFAPIWSPDGKSHRLQPRRQSVLESLRQGRRGHRRAAVAPRERRRTSS